MGEILHAFSYITGDPEVVDMFKVKDAEPTGVAYWEVVIGTGICKDPKATNYAYHRDAYQRHTLVYVFGSPIGYQLPED